MSDSKKQDDKPIKKANLDLELDAHTSSDKKVAASQVASLANALLLPLPKQSECLSEVSNKKLAVSLDGLLGSSSSSSSSAAAAAAGGATGYSCEDTDEGAHGEADLGRGGLRKK